VFVLQLSEFLFLFNVLIRRILLRDLAAQPNYEIKSIFFFINSKQFLIFKQRQTMADLLFLEKHEQQISEFEVIFQITVANSSRKGETWSICTKLTQFISKIFCNF
jgi:hypothetical protein